LSDCLCQSLYNPLPKVFWTDHFHIWPESEHIHDEFGRITVRHAKLIASIVQPTSALIWMPAFLCHPSRSMGSEVQYGLRDSGTAEQPIPRGKVSIEVLIRDVYSGLIKQFHGLQTFHSECPKFPAEVAPGVDVPVTTIVNDSLRRDLSF
jgi:hypothetical protein